MIEELEAELAKDLGGKMSHTNLIVQHAVLDDVSEFLALLEQIGYPYALDDLQARFTRFLYNPGYGVVIAKIQSEVVSLIA